MEFDFRRHKNDIIEFLNSTADGFYNGELKFYDLSYESRYKANLLGGMIDIERTIRGTFGCDFSLETADFSLIKRMYPHACEILSINGKDDLPKMGKLLNSLRNLNAHAFLSDDDISFIRNDFSMLLSEKKMHKSLLYLKDNQITVAGITFLVLIFLRSQSIETMVNDEFMVSVVSSGQYAKDDGEKFVSEISHVNLEIPIRKVKADNVLNSIFGEYGNRLIENGDEFLLSIGKETYPTFRVTGSLKQNILKINCGSLTRTYFSETYLLKIDETDAFIEMSNSLPMMVLVDYLYESGIETFDREATSKIKKEFELLSKTNKPKFYADKKISLLLLKSSASDFRIISSLMIDSLSKIFILLENYIYKTRGIQRYNRNTHSHDYSTIGKALKQINVPDGIVTEVKYLRNFCAHGYMLDDYLLFKNDSRQFTLDYIISTIRLLSEHLEISVPDVYEKLKEYKCEYLINKIIRTKYKVAIDYSNIVLDVFPNYSIDKLSKKNGFINNSFFDVTVFNEITDFGIQKVRVIELFVDDINQCLFFFDNAESREKIDLFCTYYGYKITDKKDCGLIIEMTAKKI